MLLNDGKLKKNFLSRNGSINNRNYKFRRKLTVNEAIKYLK